MDGLVNNSNNVNHNPPDLARLLAPLIKESMNQVEADPFLTPAQIVGHQPALGVNMVRTDIRKGEFGKKFGPKGKLVARMSDVKKYYRL